MNNCGTIAAFYTSGLRKISLQGGACLQHVQTSMGRGLLFCILLHCVSISHTHFSLHTSPMAFLLTLSTGEARLRLSHIRRCFIQLSDHVTYLIQCPCSASEQGRDRPALRLEINGLWAHSEEPSLSQCSYLIREPMYTCQLFLRHLEA